LLGFSDYFLVVSLRDDFYFDLVGSNWMICLEGGEIFLDFEAFLSIILSTILSTSIGTVDPDLVFLGEAFAGVDGFFFSALSTFEMEIWDYLVLIFSFLSILTDLLSFLYLISVLVDLLSDSARVGEMLICLSVF